MNKPATITFKEWECEVKLGRYPADRSQIWIQLFSPTKGPIAIATVCVQPEDIPMRFPQGTVFIKDWSENDGIYTALVEQKVIEKYICYVRCGFVYAQVGVLKPSYLNEVPPL